MPLGDGVQLSRNRDVFEQKAWTPYREALRYRRLLLASMLLNLVLAGALLWPSLLKLASRFVPVRRVTVGAIAGPVSRASDPLIAAAQAAAQHRPGDVHIYRYSNTIS